jgi:hypothetical protein
MQLTVEIPDELFMKLDAVEQNVSQVLELGLNELV